MSTTEEPTISGNASPETKRHVYSVYSGLFRTRAGVFGESIVKRMKTTEVSILSKSEEETKVESRLVNEVVVHQDMLNGGGSMHGGCAAFLIDVCTTVSLMAYSFETLGDVTLSVSQSLAVVYHSPAHEGDMLRIVSTSMTVGGRAMSCRCEIWNQTRQRLVASGVHIKMTPSLPKVEAKL